MKIGLDITALIYDRGVSRYTANLIRALAADKSLELFLYGSTLRQSQRLEKMAADLTKNSAATVKIKISKIPPSLLANFWHFGLSGVRKFFPKIEVFHSWDWLQPPDKNLPLVSTIHDLAILRYPETAHKEILKKHRKSWEVLKKRDAHIIAVSEATKKDIVELLDIPADHITVIHEALPTETLEIASKLDEEKFEIIKKRLKLEKPFLLFVGTREPRKNLTRLIEAWQEFSADYDLIIAGESGWDEPKATKAKHQPRFLGKVTDLELVVLYSEAACFVYPSLYEGFGLPILEAFSFGTPVVTSNISAMPEVAGNAAVLINPLEVSSIASGIKKILDETDTEAKLRLQKMIIRLQVFSWKKVAQETKQVYAKSINAHA